MKQHGKSKTKLYGNWKTLKSRCYNKNVASYKNYGGRGITIQESWKHDFLKFESYVLSLANYKENEIGISGLTLDRIDNDGNYEEGNLRWVNKTIQKRNQRMSKNNKTGYVGVFFESKKKLYRASITINYKQHKLGRRKTAKEAYQLRVDYILKNKLQGFEIQIP